MNYKIVSPSLLYVRCTVTLPKIAFKCCIPHLLSVVLNEGSQVEDRFDSSPCQELDIQQVFCRLLPRTTRGKDWGCEEWSRCEGGPQLYSRSYQSRVRQ